MAKKLARIIGIAVLLFLPVLGLSFLAYTVFHQIILLAGAVLAGWAAFYVDKLRTEHKRLSYEVFRQIYELKNAQEALESCLATSAQTRAYNERLLNSKLTEECNRTKRYHRPLSCMMIAVDSLPELFQYHELALPETVIQEVTRFLKESLRSVDSVIRYQGDRIITLLPETNPEQVRIVVNRIHFAVEKNTFHIEGKEVKLTVRISSVSFDPTVHRGKEDVLAALEKGLPQMKKIGPGQAEGLASGTN